MNPMKNLTRRVSFSLPQNLAEAVEARAACESRSFSRQLRHLVRQALDYKSRVSRLEDDLRVIQRVRGESELPSTPPRRPHPGRLLRLVPKTEP